MFITRKEFEKENKLRDSYLPAKILQLKAELLKYDLLAQELGYEYVSEAVKKITPPSYTISVTGGPVRDSGDGREEAVLKWSWKKINPKKK